MLVLDCFGQPPDSLNYEDTAGCPSAITETPPGVVVCYQCKGSQLRFRVNLFSFGVSVIADPAFGLPCTHKYFGTRMTLIRLIYTDFLINKMKTKKNNPGKTDFIRDYPVFIPPGGIKYPFLICSTRVIRVPALRTKRCGYMVGLWREKQSTSI